MLSPVSRGPSPTQVDPFACPSFNEPLHALDRGQYQTAYELNVCYANGTSVWKSGRVASSTSALIEYKGPALASDTSYSW